MGTTPPQPPLPPRFSPDGNWFWTGTEWKPAISPDRSWRFDGYRWVPNQPPGRSGAATAGITVGVVLGAVAVLVLVGFIAIIVLLTMGNQLSNVFANVAGALTASPSPSP